MENPISKVILPTFYVPHICELTMCYLINCFQFTAVQISPTTPSTARKYVNWDNRYKDMYSTSFVVNSYQADILLSICNNKLGNDNNEIFFLFSFVTETVVNVLIRFTSIEWNDKLSDKKSDEFDSTSKKITQAVKSYIIRSQAVCFCERDWQDTSWKFVTWFRYIQASRIDRKSLSKGQSIYEERDRYL